MLNRRKLNFYIGKLNTKLSPYINREYKKIWLVGHARSGTTWISNLINNSERYISLFEPIHKIPLKKKSIGITNTYELPNQSNVKLKEIINDIFSNNLYNSRVYSKDLKLFYDGILVKDIAANLLIKWVRNEFKEIKIVFLLRHPFAICNSVEKINSWWWFDDPEVYFKQRKLYDKYLHKFENLLEYANSDFEKLILTWSIVNYVPLMEMDENDYLIVFYEDICANPVDELKKIYDWLGINIESINNSKLEQLIKTPSRVSRNDSAINTGKSLIDTWSNELTSTQINKGMKILNEFSLDKIYNTELFPEKNGLKYFLNKEG